MTETHYIAIV